MVKKLKREAADAAELKKQNVTLSQDVVTVRRAAAEQVTPFQSHVTPHFVVIAARHQPRELVELRPANAMIETLHKQNEELNMQAVELKEQIEQLTNAKQISEDEQSIEMRKQLDGLKADNTMQVREVLPTPDP